MNKKFETSLDVLSVLNSFEFSILVDRGQIVPHWGDLARCIGKNMAGSVELLGLPSDWPGMEKAKKYIFLLENADDGVSFSWVFNYAISVDELLCNEVVSFAGRENPQLAAQIARVCGRAVFIAASPLLARFEQERPSLPY